MFPRGMSRLALFALSSALLLFTCVRAEQKNDVDTLGDSLPEGAFARIGTQRLRHAARIAKVAFSSDGKLLASLGMDGEVRVWDLSADKLPTLLGNPLEGIVAVAFVPGKRQLLLVKSKLTPKGLPDEIEFAKRIGLELPTRYVSVWDVDAGKEIRALYGSAGSDLKAVAVSGDGKHVVSPDDSRRELLVWNLVEGTLVSRLKSGYAGSHAVALSADGTLVAHGGAGEISFWSVPDNRRVATLRRQDFQSKDSRGLVVAFDARTSQLRITTFDTAAIWDLEHKQLLFHEHQSSFVSCWSPDDSCRRVLWTEGQLLLVDKAQRTRLGELSDCAALAFSPSGARIAATDGNRVAVYDVLKRQEVFSESGVFPNSIRNFAFAGDSSIIAELATGIIVKWDASSRETKPFGRERGSGLAVSPDGHIYMLSADGFLQARDTGSHKEIARVRSRTCPSSGLRFSPGGEYLAGVYENRGFAVLETKTWKTALLLPDTVDVRGVAFSADGDKLAVAQAGHDDPRIVRDDISIWDVASGKYVSSLKSSSRCLDPGFIAGGSFLIARVWDRRTWKRVWWNLYSSDVIRQEPGVKNGATAIAPNQMVMAVVDNDGAIVILETLTGSVIRKLPARSTSAARMEFSPHGVWLASLHWDGTMLLWNWLDHPIKDALDGTCAELWEQLRDQDTAKAYRAIHALVDRGVDAVAFLDKKLNPISENDSAVSEKLTRQLADSEPAVRLEAYRRLLAAGKGAEVGLRTVKLPPGDLEANNARDKLLAQIPVYYAALDEVQSLRAIQVLEYRGTQYSRRVLERLADGLPGAALTEAAKAALTRVRKRPSGNQGR